MDYAWSIASALYQITHGGICEPRTASAVAYLEEQAQADANYAQAILTGIIAALRSGEFSRAPVGPGPVPAQIVGWTCLPCKETFRPDVLGQHVATVHGGKVTTPNL